MDVLDDQDERTLLGERLKEPAPSRERLVAAVAANLLLPGEAEKREQMRLDAPLVARPREYVLDRTVDLRRDVRRRVLFEDASLRFDDLAERPQRDPVPVREAAALPPRDELGIRLDGAIEFVHEPALSDPWHAHERKELWGALVTCALEGVTDDAELALAAHEFRARLVRDVDTEAGVSCDSRPDGNGLRLALRLDRSRLLVVDGGPGRAIGHLVGQDAVDGGGALQAGGGVDDVAGCHALSRARPRVEPDERLSGRDPYAQLECLLDRKVADRKGGSDRALRVVLVRSRRTEQRHNRVPDEFLDGAAVPLELGPHAFVVGAEHRVDVLRIHRLRLRREPDEIAENDRNDLALSARCTSWHGPETMTSTRVPT